MSIKETAKQNLGELFVTGFSGLELSSETADWIRETRIGGIILFAPNYESPAQVAELINEIQKNRYENPLWVSVDHEGGRVQRFRKPFTRIPEMFEIGRTQSPKLAFEVAAIMAKELKCVGINLNYSPIADIHTNLKNPVIGHRAFGDHEEIVSKMVSAFVRGHITHHVQPCVKHFPGHGDTTTDSHFALPRVDTPVDLLKKRELQPFAKGFKSGCHFVMTAHIINPHLDKDFPVTLSKSVIQSLLRGEMRFKGLIMSDDLEMKAITDHFGEADAPRMALQAGCDLLIYRSEGAARAAHQALLKAIDSGELDAQDVMDKVARSRALKKEVLPPYQPVIIADVLKNIGLPESQKLIAQITGVDPATLA